MNSIRNCKNCRFSEVYPDYFTMLKFILPLSSRDSCSHTSLWYVRHPIAGPENIMVLSWPALHILNRLSLSTFNKHLSFPFSHNEHNVC